MIGLCVHINFFGKNYSKFFILLDIVLLVSKNHAEDSTNQSQEGQGEIETLLTGLEGKVIPNSKNHETQGKCNCQNGPGIEVESGDEIVNHFCETCFGNIFNSIYRAAFGKSQIRLNIGIIWRKLQGFVVVINTRCN